MILPQKIRKTKPLRLKICIRVISLKLNDKDCLSTARRYNLLYSSCSKSIMFSRYFIYRLQNDKLSLLKL
ncbi:hypothetical protein DVQ78_05405 [Yersinia enterocolitica]|nr:hypothetical protein [Yersinia enterocolitica]EKN6270576.1 hypothetical protein [Yersinia enterocolitica]